MFSEPPVSLPKDEPSPSSCRPSASDTATSDTPAITPPISNARRCWRKRRRSPTGAAVLRSSSTAATAAGVGGPSTTPVARVVGATLARRAAGIASSRGSSAARPNITLPASMKNSPAPSRSYCSVMYCRSSRASAPSNAPAPNTAQRSCGRSPRHQTVAATAATSSSSVARVTSSESVTNSPEDSDPIRRLISERSKNSSDQERSCISAYRHCDSPDAQLVNNPTSATHSPSTIHIAGAAAAACQPTRAAGASAAGVSTAGRSAAEAVSTSTAPVPPPSGSGVARRKGLASSASTSLDIEIASVPGESVDSCLVGAASGRTEARSAAARYSIPSVFSGSSTRIRSRMTRASPHSPRATCSSTSSSRRCT